LTLAFSSKPQIKNGIDKFFFETYFSKESSPEESISKIKQLIQFAKVSDLVCIEEIVSRCASEST
jgi:hypothetical protein